MSDTWLFCTDLETDIPLTDDDEKQLHEPEVAPLNSKDLWF